MALLPRDLDDMSRSLWDKIRRKDPFFDVSREAKSLFSVFITESPHFRLAYGFFLRGAKERVAITPEETVKFVTERIEEESPVFGSFDFEEKTLLTISGVIAAREMTVSSIPISVILEMDEERTKRYVLPFLEYAGYDLRAKEYIRRMLYAKYA